MTFAGRSTAFRTPLPWPTPPERLIFAGLAWIPLALLVAFGGGALSGCDAASVGCPAVVPPLQAAALVALLLGLLALPRAAYLATGAGLGMIAAGIGVLLVSGTWGLLTLGGGSGGPGGPDRSPSALAAALVVLLLLVAYVLAGLATWRDHPVRRPWLARPRPHPPGETARPDPRR